jgi:hypothetical protein
VKTARNTHLQLSVVKYQFQQEAIISVKQFYPKFIRLQHNYSKQVLFFNRRLTHIFHQYFTRIISMLRSNNHSNYFQFTFSLNNNNTWIKNCTAIEKCNTL